MQTICTAIGALGITCHTQNPSIEVLEQTFVKHIADYGLSYGTNEEYKFRLELFAAKEKEINEINDDINNTFVLAHNMFSTYTKAEMKGFHTGRVDLKNTTIPVKTETLDVEATPESVDWRTKGVVNPVQNQGQCGSCWAFSSTAAVESAHAIKTGNLLKLAEQQLVDCSTQNGGCNGGMEYLAFEYLQTHAQVLRADYPYDARTGTCKLTDEMVGQVSTTGYTRVPHRSAAQLKAALAIEPVCVAVDAANTYFQSYSSGILNTTRCGTNLDHAITAVGYGSEGGHDYFIVRNSWTASWGEQGYIRMSADVAGAGVCGILLDPVYPQTD